MSSFSLFFAFDENKQTISCLFHNLFPRLNTVVKSTQHRVIMVSTNFLSSSSSYYSWSHYSLLVLIIVYSVSARVFFSSSSSSTSRRRKLTNLLFLNTHTHAHTRQVGTRRSSRLSGGGDKDLAELPLTPVSKRKTPTKKKADAATSNKVEDGKKKEAEEKNKKKKSDGDAKTPSSKDEKKKNADAKKPLPATNEKQSSKKGKDASSKEKTVTPTPTMGEIAAKEKRKLDEIQQSRQQQQQQQHEHHHSKKKVKRQQTPEQIERGLEKKKKKKSKKARKREREALATKEAGQDGNVAKKAKIIPSTETAVNGTTKWSFGDWTCRKCGAHNYRKQKDKCFRCSYPKAIETNMKQGNHGAREYLNGKLKEDKNWTFSNQEHEWCVRNASFDPLMKDEVYDLFLKYLEKMEAKHRDRVRDGANAVIERMKRALSVLEKFPTHEEEIDAKRALFTEGLGAPDGEKKKKKKKRNRKKKKKHTDEEAPEKSALGGEEKEKEEAQK